MKLVMLALGTRGDIQPYIALAEGFAAAGHDVKFVSDQAAAPLLAQRGMQGSLLSGSLRVSDYVGEIFRYRRNPYKLMRLMAEVAAPLMANYLKEATDLLAGSDMIVTSSVAAPLGQAVVEKLRIPIYGASTVSLAPTLHLPPAFLPWPDLLPPGRITRGMHKIAQRLIWLGQRRTINAFRHAQRLAPLQRPMELVGVPAYPQIFGFSPRVLPRPPDWSANLAIAGYWYHRLDANYRPPPALEKFVASGPAPVYIGFGSTMDPDPEGLSRIVKTATERLGLRAVLSSGQGTLSTAAASEDVFILEEADYEWLFPRMAAIVHHGGAGTTGAAVRAGVPSVVVPYISDQPFWGWVLRQRGVAPRAIPRQKLTVDSLCWALRMATSDADMRQRARNLGELVRAEDGVGKAVEAIELWARFQAKMASRRGGLRRKPAPGPTG
jgi:sterol 3beta-glucosyltransferase